MENETSPAQGDLAPLPEQLLRFIAETIANGINGTTSQGEEVERCIPCEIPIEGFGTWRVINAIVQPTKTGRFLVGVEFVHEEVAEKDGFIDFNEPLYILREPHQYTLGYAVYAKRGHHPGNRG